MAERPPAKMKPQAYGDSRPAEHFAHYHERVRRGKPNAVFEVVRMLMFPFAVLIFRGRCISSENVPDGAVILAPNHFSHLDHFFLGTFVRRRVQFMAKSQLFHPPLQWIYKYGGTFPVRRGAGDTEGIITADAVLARGSAMVMYCEGGRSRTGDLASTPKRGIGRLALESGVPIVPVAIYGSSMVRNWKRLQFPRVTVQFGLPIRFEQVQEPTREQQQAAANEIFSLIRNLYENLAQNGRVETVKRLGDERKAAPR